MSLSRNPWVRLSLDLVQLGVESQSVVSLRLAKLARGGFAAAEETHLMVSEKVGAAMSAPFQVASDLLSPGPGAALRTTATLLRKVRANRRRLSRAR
jgi:hypothetical protein